MSEAAIRIRGYDETRAAFASAKASLTGLKNEAAGLQDRFDGLSAKIGTIGVAIGAALAGASLKGVIDLADQMDDLSEKTGIAVTDLTGLRYAGEVVGTPIESLAKGIQKLSQNMASAAGGGKEQAAAFQAIGVSFRNLDGSLRGSDKVLGDLANKFASFRDGPEKAALAVELFGKAGAEMIPLLNQGAEGISTLRGEGEKLGAVFGGDLAKSAAEFNDNLTKIRISAESSKLAIANELLPTLNELGRAFIESKDGSASFASTIGQGLAVGLKVVSAIVADFSFLLRSVTRGIAEVAANVRALFDGDIIQNFKDAWLGKFKPFTFISDAVREDQQRAERELEQFKDRLFNRNADLAGAGRGSASDPRILGTVGSIAEQTRDWKRAAPVVGKPGSTREEKSAYEALNAEIQKRLELMDAEQTQGRKLTEIEKYVLETRLKLNDETTKLTEAERKRLRASLDTVEAQGSLYEQFVRDLEFSKQARAENEKAADTMQRLADSTREKLQAQLEENQTIGLTATAVAALERQRLADAAASYEQRAATLDLIPGMESMAQAARDAAVAMRSLGDAKVSGAIKREMTDSARDVEEEWKRSTEQISNTLTDALMRGFEDGKDFAKNFRDTLVNMFKTLVLRPVISAVVNPIAGAINNTIGSFLGGGSGALGMASNGMSLYRGYNMLNSAGGLTINAATGQTVANLFGGGAGGSFSSTVGGGLATDAMGQTVIQGASGATLSGAGGMGQMLSSLGPYALIAAFILKGASMMRGETRSGGQYGYSFDGETAYSNRRGRNFEAGSIGATFLEGPSGGVLKDENGNDLGAALVDATVGNINSLFKNLGTDISVTGFNAGFESSESGRGGVFSGGRLSTGALFGESGQGDNYKGTLFEQWTQGGLSTTALGTKEAFAAFGIDMQSVVIQALQAGANMAPRSVVTEKEAWQQAGSDGGYMSPYNEYSRVFDPGQIESEILPKTIRDMIRGVDVEGLKDSEVTELFNKINATVQGVVDLSAALDVQPFSALTKASFDAKASLVALAEGLDEVAGNGAATLAALRAGYVNNFYNADEKRNLTAQNISKTLTAAGGAFTVEDVLNLDRSEFRALVDETEEKAATGDAAAQKFLLSLYSVADALASITPEMQAVADATDDATEALEKARKAQRDAFDALDRAIDAERAKLNVRRDVLAESIGQLDDVMGMLHGNVRELLDGDGAASGARAAQGNAFIQQALEAARSSGYVSDSDALSDAIAAARGGLNAENYGSQFELDRDRLVLAGRLSELESIAGTQRTFQQQQLDAIDKELKGLDETLDYWRQQIELSEGNVTAVLSVTDAIKALQEKMFPTAKEAAGDAPAAASTVGGAVFGGTGSGGAAATATIDENGVRHYSDGSFGALSEGELDLWKRGLLGKVPFLDGGTNRVPQDMLAVIHEGEAVIPEPFNPYFQYEGGGANEAMAQAIRELLTEVGQLRVAVNVGNVHALRTANATNGNPEVPMPVDVT